ncbi:hypothetical protein R1flu_019357 [Riccia fluitans]|uniref:Uncharacterized protein n=1 Tax=Riccia fluitans TaxID=41844 RepID=A0ABD1ZMA0_9MARC
MGVLDISRFGITVVMFVSALEYKLGDRKTEFLAVGYGWRVCDAALNNIQELMQGFRSNGSSLRRAGADPSQHTFGRIGIRCYVLMAIKKIQFSSREPEEKGVLVREALRRKSR